MPTGTTPWLSKKLRSDALTARTLLARCAVTQSHPFRKRRINPERLAHTSPWKICSRLGMAVKNPAIIPRKPALGTTVINRSKRVRLNKPVSTTKVRKSAKGDILRAIGIWII